MKVLGVSGSPIQNSNTDRAVQLVLAATGVKKQEFVKLSDYTVSPCNGCLGCVATNRCLLEDDGGLLAEKVYKADALIVGGFAPYASLDSRTKAFLERLYPLRHRHGLMAGKPGAAIVTCAMSRESQGGGPACENGLAAIRSYMVIEKMHFVGGVAIHGNVPCVKCQAPCQHSGLKLLHGPEATVASVGIKTLEEDARAVAALQALAEELVAACYGR